MSDISELADWLKDINEHHSMIVGDFNDFQKACKHAMLTCATSIQTLRDLEDDTKDTKKPADQRNANLKTGLNKAIKSFLDESQKIRKWNMELTSGISRHFKQW